MPTPVNIISGFLGTGKTTTLMHALQHRPEGERWAILVNEFGEVGIDGAMLEGAPGSDGVTVRELPGGCICCTAGVMFQLAAAQVLRAQRPDRLLVEPTGLASLQSVIDTFYGPGLRDSTEVRSVITLVDPRHWSSDRHRQHEVWQAQVDAADVLLASRVDLATDEQIARLEGEAAGLFPPKQHIGRIHRGQIDMALFDLARPRTEAATLEVHGHSHDHEHSHDHGHHHHEHGASAEPIEGEPTIAHGDEADACGWVFPHTTVFDWEGLIRWVDAAPWAERVKGVFRTNRGWVALNATAEDLSTTATAHRRDSRVEVIAAHGVSPDWQSLHDALEGCQL